MHWKAITRVLGYLKRTKDLGLFYNNFPAVLEGYTDASWITSTHDKISTSGWIFILGGSAVANMYNTFDHGVGIYCLSSSGQGS